MTYFVLAHKRDQTGLSCYGIMENCRLGGYKSKEQAYKRFREYATSEIRVYTGNGLKTVAVRVNGREMV